MAEHRKGHPTATVFTSKRTIETRRQNIMEKMQAKNTAALIKLSVSRGLIS